MRKIEKDNEIFLAGYIHNEFVELVDDSAGVVDDDGHEDDDDDEDSDEDDHDDDDYDDENKL